MGPVPRRALIGWVLFDCACQPFFTLVTTFVFAPYVATVLSGDPVSGQASWGYATAAAGLVLAVLSPLLGATADETGPKKPGIAAACAILAIASGLLWWARPGRSGALPLALWCYGIGTVAAEIAAVLNNAMMARLAGPRLLGRLSGIGWAVGYAGGLVSLALVLAFLVVDPATGRTHLGLAPLLGAGAHEGERAVGPLSAVWLLLLVWPLFAWTPDAPRRATRLGPALRRGLATLGGAVKEARGRPALGRFLLANMVYQDGLVALFGFGGIYGAGVFGWGPTELGLFGILLTVTGTIGAVIGGILDDRFGARPVIQGSLATLVLVCLGILSLGRNHVLFAWPTGPGSGGLYGSAPERAFVLLGLLIGAVAGPLQAASRSHLARLIPADEGGRWFGLLALSGKLTSFLAPLAVAFATEAAGTQAAGPAVLVVFFLAGATLMRGSRPAPLSAGSGARL